MIDVMARCMNKNKLEKPIDNIKKVEYYIDYSTEYSSDYSS